jgi:hypothetical protein
MDSIAYPGDGRDYSAYIPDHEDGPVTARTLQGMARVRSGQAPAASDTSYPSSEASHDVSAQLPLEFAL